MPALWTILERHIDHFHFHSTGQNMLSDLAVTSILDGCESRMTGEWDGGPRDKHSELGGEPRKGPDRSDQAKTKTPSTPRQEPCHITTIHSLPSLQPLWEMRERGRGGCWSSMASGTMWDRVHGCRTLALFARHRVTLLGLMFLKEKTLRAAVLLPGSVDWQECF